MLVAASRLKSCKTGPHPIDRASLATVAMPERDEREPAVHQSLVLCVA